MVIWRLWIPFLLQGFNSQNTCFKLLLEFLIFWGLHSKIYLKIIGHIALRSITVNIYLQFHSLSELRLHNIVKRIVFHLSYRLKISMFIRQPNTIIIHQLSNIFLSCTYYLVFFICSLLLVYKRLEKEKQKI